MKKITEFFQANSYRGRFLVAVLCLVLLLVVYPIQIGHKLITKEENNINFQKVLNIDSQEIINDKLYVKDNKVYANFIRKTKVFDKDNFTNTIDEFNQLNGNLTTPIYIKYGVSDKVMVEQNGNVKTDYDKSQVKYMGENYLKINENLLFDKDKLLEQNKKMIVIELYGDVDRTQIKDNDLPKFVINFHVSSLLDYIDISNLEYDIYNIKNNPELSKTYSKWIYKQVLNPTIFTSYVSDSENKTQTYNLVKTINENNVLDVIISLYNVKNNILINFMEVNKTLNYNNKELKNINYNIYKNIMETYSNVELNQYESYVKYISNLTKENDRFLEKELEEYLKNISPDDKKYSQYYDNVDMYSLLDKIYILSYLSVN